MEKNYVKKTLRLNTPLRGHDAGAEIRIKVDKKTGLPLDPYWRNRLKDSEHEKDGCCEFVGKQAKTKKAEPQGS